MSTKHDLRGFQRSYLLKEAHSLKPVVMVGRGGFSEGIVKALDAALQAHELVKVKFQDYKEAKQDISRQLAGETDAVLVRIIGNIAVFFRPNEDEEKRKIYIPGEHFE